MTLKKQIEAASAKATPGDWFIQPIKGYPHDEVYGRDANGALTGICAGGAAGYEDAPLIVTLVNAYRAGKLLVIEDEADAVRDMLAAVLVVLTRKGFRADQLECLTHGNGRGTIPPKALEHALTAALAALKGE